MTRKVITVFGASGFIGRHLVRRLCRAGWIVRAVNRDAEKSLFLKPMGNVGQVVPWPADVLVGSEVDAACDGADAVVNLIGVLYESGRRTFSAMHVDAAASIAAAAAKAGAGALVHVSALGADTFSQALYARTKALGEERVREAFPAATILRPSVIFGPEDNFFNMFATLSRFTPALPVIGCPTLPKVEMFGDKGLISIDLYGDGGPKFQPVYVGDVADAIMSSLSGGEAAGQTFELCGPSVYSFKQIMELVLKYTGRKRWLAPVPFWAASLEAWFLEKLPKPLLTCDQVTLLQSDNVATGATPGLSDLGIQATSAEAILPTYMHHFHTPATREAQKAS